MFVHDDDALVAVSDVGMAMLYNLFRGPMLKIDYSIGLPLSLRG